MAAAWGAHRCSRTAAAGGGGVEWYAVQQRGKAGHWHVSATMAVAVAVAVVGVGVGVRIALLLVLAPQPWERHANRHAPQLPP